MSVRNPDSTFFADYKADCCDGTYYIYVNNEAKLPENEIVELVKEIKANLEDAVRFERYLKNKYKADVSLKIIKKETKEIFLVDEENIEDFTNITNRIKDKFFELFEEKITNLNNKNKSNYYIFLFLCLIFLTGTLSISPSNKNLISIEGKGENTNVEREQQFYQRQSYSTTNTFTIEIP